MCGDGAGLSGGDCVGLVDEFEGEGLAAGDKHAQRHARPGDDANRDIGADRRRELAGQSGGGLLAVVDDDGVKRRAL